MLFRSDAFCTNRKLNGIRPFPSPSESEYDTFTCGHASNSISAALGMAVAAKKHGENNRHVVAVIGDGSMSGGLAFEGLNNASSTPNNLLIILNDNNMAIDRSVGGMKQYLLNLQMSEAGLRTVASIHPTSSPYSSEKKADSGSGRETLRNSSESSRSSTPERAGNSRVVDILGS